MADFEDGPFFDIEATVAPHLGKHVIVWATDEDVARRIAILGGKLLGVATATFLGTLEDVKDTHRLAPSQIADLHREGFLVLTN